MEPKGGPVDPKASQSEAREAPREPKGMPGGPQGNPVGCQGGPREPKRRPGGLQGTPRGGQGDPKGTQRDARWTPREPEVKTCCMFESGQVKVPSPCFMSRS